MGKSREGFTVHIKLSGEKNGTSKAVVKIAATLEEKRGRMRRLEQVRLLTECSEQPPAQARSVSCGSFIAAREQPSNLSGNKRRKRVQQQIFQQDGNLRGDVSRDTGTA